MSKPNQPKDGAEMVAPLRGRVQKFYTYRNGRKRGPYYVRCWKENGKQKRVYVRLAKVAEVRAACKLHKQWVAEQKKVEESIAIQVANFNFYLRMASRVDRNKPSTPEQVAHIEALARRGFLKAGRPTLRGSGMVCITKRAKCNIWVQIRRKKSSPSNLHCEAREIVGDGQTPEVTRSDAD